MLTLEGKLDRIQYWRMLVAWLVLYTVTVALTLFLLELLGADKPNAGALREIMALILFVALCVEALVGAYSAFGIVMRRSRDIGRTVLWTIVALFLPLGWVLIGLIPGSKPTK